MMAALGLQLALPSPYVFGSRWVLVAAEILLLVALSFTTPRERIFRSFSRRINVFLLIATISATNLYALIQLADKLLSSGQILNGRDLILSALNIYLTNIIIFGLLYWEMDGGGPGQRLNTAKHEQDFLFPQEQNTDYKHSFWQPTFIDYVYVSATNSMAFSPTDTMPLSRRAKLLMLAQATVALITIALVAARAVNILH
jgi:hypothetical protein